MKEFKLPELGENIVDADILKLLVNVGDSIKIDTPILEIETDKATIEVPSTVEGKVHKILVKEGDKAKVHQVILLVDESVTSKSETHFEVSDKKEEAGKIKPAIVEQNNFPVSNEVIEFSLPDLGENIKTADVLKVLVKKGELIKIEQVILEIETDKATIEVPSTVEGKVIEIFVKDGDKVSPGQVVLKVNSDVAQLENTITDITSIKDTVPETKIEKLVVESTFENVKDKTISFDNQPPILYEAAPAAPSVRRLARELGVDINKIPGSGPNGRISLDDVKAYVKKLNLERSSDSNFISTMKQEPLPDFSKYGSIERQSMNKIKIKTAEHLSYAWQTIPHVTQFDKADATELEKMRKQLSIQFEKEGVKLTATAYLVKIVSYALKVFPQFNSSIDMEKKEIITKKYVNIGVAVDTENGLIVPVIKNADKKSLKEISIEITALADKARKRKISLDELQGGCFSISNLGGIGGTYFTPIVNSPEVAILGISRSFYEPQYKDGQLVPRLMLPLSLSYDHRVIDGADGIRFLRWIVEAIENPLKIL